MMGRQLRGSCVVACPTGAIGADGQFNFSACYTHNYREFMGGFNDWVKKIADSANARQYPTSIWQSLSFGANYKAAYCMAVCPAGEDVIAPFLTNRKQYLDDVVRPLQNKPEAIYVIADSDAESYVARLRSIAAFLRACQRHFRKGNRLV